jgi:hypothetical protein
MPTPFDLLSQKLNDPDPEDDLQMMLGQDQGANLAGGPEAQPDAQPNLGAPPGMAGSPQPVAPSPNVPGPLAALTKLVPKSKPHIRLKSQSPPPKVKKIKPRIKLKASAYV